MSGLHFKSYSVEEYAEAIGDLKRGYDEQDAEFSDEHVQKNTDRRYSKVGLEFMARRSGRPILPNCKPGEPPKQAFDYVGKLHHWQLKAGRTHKDGYESILKRLPTKCCANCGAAVTHLKNKFLILGFLLGWKQKHIADFTGWHKGTVSRRLKWLRESWSYMVCQRCGAAVKITDLTHKQALVFTMRDRYGLQEKEIAGYLSTTQQAVNRMKGRIIQNHPALERRMLARQRVKYQTKFRLGEVWRLVNIDGYSVIDTAYLLRMRAKSVSYALMADRIEVRDDRAYPIREVAPIKTISSYDLSRYVVREIL